MPYEDPQHIENNNIFIIQRSEIEGRWDAQYYNTDIHIPNAIPLSLFASVKGGKRIPKGYSYSDEQTKYYYLRVADMDNDREISFDTLKCIDEKIFTILERYEIKEGELAISIAGTIGKVCVLTNIPYGKHVILTENCAKIVIHNQDKLNVNYLEILFKMPFIQKQLEMSYIQTTIPKLGLDKILSLKFPPIPTIDFQIQVIDLFNSAYQSKQQKESEAQQLLDNIDTYLFDELGMVIPKISTNLTNRIVITNFKDIVDTRIDPYYTMYVNHEYQSTKFENVSLGRIANIVKGTALTSKDIVQGNIPVIAGGQTAPYYHNTSNFEGNVITISASGAYAGFVWYHTCPIFATDCTVVYSKDKTKFLTAYIYEVLRYLQSVIYRLQVGAAQPHVYPTDLMNIQIPCLPIEQQKTIVEKMTNIRQRAMALQADGKAILENAKKEVERMIIRE